MRRTKIVCTLGPASNTEGVIAKMVKAGMDVARLNFSHGAYLEHLATLKLVRRVSAKLGKPIAVLQDLQGPKLRLGLFAGHMARLKKGASFVLTTRKIVGSSEGASVTYANLPRDVKKGDLICLNDGAIRLVTTAVKGDCVHTKVTQGGIISDHKGINLPQTTLSTPSTTRKDFADLNFGLKMGVDYVALSFVRSPDDVIRLKKFIRKKGHDTPVVAKIEKFEALGHLEEIVKASDGVMVARGDLGVETPLEDVPVHQKEIIRACARFMKPVITATQMLESMVDAPSPTRAEVSDVANAILDGTDAVMLSAETSVGKYPVKAVRTMARVAERTERMVGEGCAAPLSEKDEPVPVSESVGQAACLMADRLNVKVLIAFTESGFTARLISKFRPASPIIGVTPTERAQRRMALYRGVLPVKVKRVKVIDEMVKNTMERVRKMGLLKKGDHAVITAGVPFAVTGSTNLIKVATA